MSEQKENQIYHEKQSFMLCAIHCLNNLFQCKYNKDLNMHIFIILLFFFSKRIHKTTF